MALSKEELLRPRYKVIADYPNSPFREGEILYTRMGNCCKQGYDVIKQVGNDEFVYVESYPHLFQPLPWWAERSIDELPEYVKRKGVVYKAIWSKNYLEELVQI